jgi:4-alpha-glucanotransferase
MARGGTTRLGPIARRHGILTEYVDATGRMRRASPRTLRALLAAIGVRTDGAGRGRSGRAAPARPGPGVIRVRLPVARRRLRIPGLDRKRPRLRLWIRREGDPRWRALEVDTARTFRVPAGLGPGVHSLRVDGSGPPRELALLVAPRRLAATAPERQWGVFAPVYALRDARTWGCGDLRTLEALGRWAAGLGATTVATLPLLPAWLDRPLEPSPYRPVSRRFWNELYLDPRSTPEFRRSRYLRRWTRSTVFRRRVATLEREPFVDFRSVARLKRTVVERMLREFARAPASRRRAYRRFVRRTEGLVEYARFRAHAESGGSRSEEYHRFAQWLTDEQLRGVARRLRRRGVRLALDLPLGAHPRGFDAEAEAELCARAVHVGSPPDPGVPGGQDWNFAPWIPERLRDVGYRPFADALRHQFSVAGILRVDHALGLHRLFWIPAGARPRDGAYVRSRAPELYDVLVAEASRAGAEVVGEDLGTVPPELRPALRRRGLLSVYVAELEWDGPGRPRAIPRGSVASLNTHDHLPFAGYWAARAGRTSFASVRAGFPPPSTPAAEAVRIATERLARSPARLLLVNLEDLWGETRTQNVPGMPGRQFARRCARTLESLRRDRASAEWLCTLDALRRRGYAR